MAGMSPTQLSLRKLKSEGYETVQVVEVWIPFSRTRRDLFGAWDILAVKNGETVPYRLLPNQICQLELRRLQTTIM